MFKKSIFSRSLLFLFLMVLTVQAASLNLVPMPKTVILKKGNFTFDNSVVIRVPADCDSVIAFSAQLLQAEVTADLNLTLPVQSESGKRTIHLAICSQDEQMEQICRKNKLSVTEELGKEGYVILVRSKEIAVTSLTARGLFYGVQTLKQLIRGNAVENRIPAVSIRDFPDMAIRGFQDDISRGPVPTMSFLKTEIRRMAEVKINYLAYYTEHVFQSTKYPEFAPPGGSLSAEDIKELSNYARKYQIELLGNFQSFGHLSHILKHPRFAHLRETRSVISPVFEESYEFLENILTEVAQAYDSPLFNINCDETHGLGKGPAKAMVEEIGIDSVYARHINRIQGILEAQGKRVMMWGDIALKYPEIIPQIAKNTIMGSWNYGALYDFEWAIIPFREAGFDVIVCPGINCWNRLL
ncbi:beta-N-acetylhexosaminidase, partial [bacterium]|nr:beta-N-acetylhexosaminidase [bacterium]